MVVGTGVLGLVALSLGTPDACSGALDEDVIGPNGGLVRSADGRLTLEIPGNALADDVNIAVYAVDCDRDDQAECYEVTPHGVVFRFPAKATYEAADLMSMDSVELVERGPDGWEPMADMDLDRENETVTASMLFSSSISVHAQ